MADMMSHQLHFEIERHHDFINDGQLFNLYQSDRQITPLHGQVPTTGPSGLVRLEDYLYFIKDGSLHSFRIDGPRQSNETERMDLPDHDGSQVILGLVPHVDYVFVWTADSIFRFGRTRRLSKIQISERDSTGEQYLKAENDLTMRGVAAQTGLPNKVELLIHSTSKKVYKAFFMLPNVLVREELFEDDGQLLGGFRDTIVMISSKEGQKTSLKLFESSRFSSEVVPAMRLEEGSTAFLDEHCVHVIDPEDGRIESMNLLHENLRWTTPKASVLVRGGWAFRGETDGPRPHWCMERGNPLQAL